MEELDISRETIDRLKEYQDLLLKWNKSFNLIGTKEKENIWFRHIVDSAQLLNFIKTKNIELLDVGSGAGLPGIVLSICGIKKVFLVESNAKKCSFLLQASRISSNKIEIINDRAENLSMECDILTCRAFASVTRIFEATEGIAVREKYLLLKGKNYFSELKNAGQTAIIHDSITCETGKILEIHGTNIRRN